MQDNQNAGWSTTDADDDSGMTVGEILGVFRRRLKLLILAPAAGGAMAFGITSLIAPTFTASTTLMPPQQAQGGAASALASLGSLAGLVGGTAGLSGSGDRYVALLQSVTVSDRIVEQFKLMEIYEAKFRVDARKELSNNVRIALGKKDGLITVEVDDKSPQRAADIANRYVDELRRVMGTLAVTEAQQRRVFFERQLQQSRDRLVKAQQALQASGFNPGALKAEPKAAADTYARLKAEATAADVKLQVLRNSLADGTPEVRQQQTTLAAIREQLARAELTTYNSGGSDYIGNYREFKYQETLFELYARQFEIARVDESREGALIQVVDAATPPERKSKPKRGVTTLAGVLLALLATAGFVLVRYAIDRPTASAEKPAQEGKA